ncbi:CaiB/BaiF CoA transferase family protein [Nocardia carnea]|uniref:CaiB/BaiF CoA transferase family protein n=1 Tax=Nocardia TaxID=1817 RepID=UPI002456FBEB|nr:CoA transferase [Nocardia carnea]
MAHPTDTGARPQSAPRPLEGVVVLDVTLALSGPYATLLLAGLGARVIKVENPRGGDAARENSPYCGRDGVALSRKHPDDMSLAAMSRMRNKESVTIDLKSAEGKGLLLGLAEKADILVQNFSAGTMEKLGLHYDAVRAVNPALVYCSISGFGSDAPSSAKAMDSIIQAMSGAMLTSGTPEDDPVRVGFPIADLAAPLFGVIGVLAALHQARRTGVGQHLDVSMLGALTSLVSVEPWAAMEHLGIPLRTGASMPRLAPFGNYRTKDGHVVICAPLDAFARGLFAAMGQADLVEDPRFATRDARVENSTALDAAIEEWTSGLTTAEAVAELHTFGVPAGDVREPQTAVADAAAVRRGDTTRLDHPAYPQEIALHGPGIPISFSGATIGLDRTPPALGEHTDSVLTELLGLDAGRLRELREAGAV